MTAHYEDGPVQVWHGDCIDVMRELPDNSIDAVVTDPPYGLEFMGKDWEREADYLPLILKRIRKPHAVGLDFGEWEA